MFPEKKLICYKNHSIYYIDKTLVIDHIDKSFSELEINLIDNEELKKDYQENYKSIKTKINKPDNKNKIRNHSNEEKYEENFSLLGDNGNKINELNDYNNIIIIDKQIDSYLMENESINMSKLNLFTDENDINILIKNNSEINNILNSINNTSDKTNIDFLEKIKNNIKNNSIYDPDNNIFPNKITEDKLKIVNDSDKIRKSYSHFISNETNNIIKKNIPKVLEYDLLITKQSNSAKIKKDIIFNNEFDFYPINNTFPNSDFNNNIDNSLIIKNEENKNEDSKLIKYIEEQKYNNSAINRDFVKIIEDNENMNFIRNLRNIFNQQSAILRLNFIFSVIKNINKIQK